MITAFLPCRLGSQRVLQKNTRPFAGREGGLIGLKLEQLAGCDEIDRILLSTNDPEIIEIGTRFAPNCSKLVIDLRPDFLCTSETSTDELVDYVPERVETGTVLWTHVTSPMVEAFNYSQMIKAFREGVEHGTYDSLMAVNALRTFIWSETGAMNYDRAIEKWPRTQTLKKLFAVNSAAFMINVDLMRRLHDRVGRTPLMFEMDEISGFEIDWEEQFTFAESIYAASHGLGASSE